jgi:hypothetical protein
LLSFAAAQFDCAAASYHCAGFAQLASNTNLTTLNNVLQSSRAASFRDVAVRSLSARLADSWDTGSNSIPLIEPLVAEILNNESCATFSATSFLMAVRLDSQHFPLWEKNMRKLFSADGKKDSGSFLVSREGDWFLFGRGELAIPMRDEYLQRIKEHNRPVPSLARTWMEGDFDLAALSPCLPAWMKLFKPAKIHLTVTPGSDELQLNARVSYPAPVEWNPAHWIFPKNLVQNPLISFTAGQNVSAFLQVSPQFLNLDASPLTNQFYAWAMSQMLMQSYMAWPVSNSSNALEKLSKELLPIANPVLKDFDGAQILDQRDASKLVLSGLRVIAPTIEPIHEDRADFLLLALFPRVPFPQPPPGQLWTHLQSRTNLVYYDWEMTGPRLQQWRLLSGMLWYQPNANINESLESIVAKEKFLGDLGNGIGKTVTEVTRESPTEFSISRAGPLGFTGLEMVLLSGWLTGSSSR